MAQIERAKTQQGRQMLKDTDLIFVNADFIDMFVDYLYQSGTNFYQFQISSAEYRAGVYNRWFKNLPPEKRQLSLI